MIENIWINWEQSVIFSSQMAYEIENVNIPAMLQ